jgi:myosin heavy subunit
VLRQLRYSGTIAALRLLQASYPTRIPYNAIYTKYRAAVPEEMRNLAPAEFTESLALALGVEPAQYALGRSMVFFRLGAAAVRHTGLEPQTSRPKAGLLLTRLSLTLARRCSRSTTLTTTRRCGRRCARASQLLPSARPRASASSAACAIM